MTVGQLIEKLQTVDQNCEVVLWKELDNGYYPAHIEPFPMKAVKFEGEQYLFSEDGAHKILAVY